jgi:hypothetical protein
VPGEHLLLSLIFANKARATHFHALLYGVGTSRALNNYTRLEWFAKDKPSGIFDIFISVMKKKGYKRFARVHYDPFKMSIQHKKTNSLAYPSMINKVTVIFGLSVTIQCHLKQINMNTDQIPKAIFLEYTF